MRLDTLLDDAALGRVSAALLLGVANLAVDVGCLIFPTEMVDGDAPGVAAKMARLGLLDSRLEAVLDEDWRERLRGGRDSKSSEL